MHVPSKAGELSSSLLPSFASSACPKPIFHEGSKVCSLC